MANCSGKCKMSYHTTRHRRTLICAATSVGAFAPTQAAPTVVPDAHLRCAQRLGPAAQRVAGAVDGLDLELVQVAAGNVRLHFVDQAQLLSRQECQAPKQVRSATLITHNAFE